MTTYLKNTVLISLLVLAGLVAGFAWIQLAEAQAPPAEVMLDAGPSTAPPMLDAGPSAGSDEASKLPGTDDPLAGASMIWKMWKAGALIPAVILLAFLLAKLLLMYVPRLNRGRVGLYVTGMLASAGIIVERAAAGSTPTTEQLVSFVLAWALLIVKAEFPGAAPSTK